MKSRRSRPSPGSSDMARILSSCCADLPILATNIPFRLGLNYKFVGTDRSASHIRNPGVMAGFFVERTDDAESACGPTLTCRVRLLYGRFGGKADIEQAVRDPICE